MNTHGRLLAVTTLCISSMAASGLRAERKDHSFIDHDDDVLECSPTAAMPRYTEERYWLYPGAKNIVDIGGNIGDDIDGYTAVHKEANVFTFEPIPHYFTHLQKKFAGNPHVHISNVGASDATGDTEFIVEGEHGWGTSGVDHSIEGEHVKVHLQDVDDILSKIQQQEGLAPDVLSVNCEGCEYAVMKRVVDQGWLGKIKYIQLSWHTPADIEDHVARRCKIEEALLQSYERVYYSFSGWVGWSLRDGK